MLAKNTRLVTAEQMWCQPAFSTFERNSLHILSRVVVCGRSQTKEVFYSISGLPRILS